MVDATGAELAQAGVADSPEVVVADAGYWHHEQMDRIAAGGIQVLIPPDAGMRKGIRPGWQGGRCEWMRRVLSTERGERLYEHAHRRRVDVRPHQHNRGMSRFHRRGRSAARTEWRLITATHNLMKLHQPHPGGRNGVNRGPKAPRRHRNRPIRHPSHPRADFRDSLDDEQARRSRLLLRDEGSGL